MRFSNLFVLAIPLFISVNALAQVSVHSGAGTDPNASSMLDVQATNKGILIPRVALTGPTDAVTVPTPATSLLIYNTASAGGLTPGYHYNSGTPGSPAWMRLMSGNTTPIDGTGAANRVTYWSGATTLTSSAEFLYGSTGNLSVLNAEGSTGEVRLGAAWDRPGVYSSTALNLFTAPSQPIIFGNNNVEYMRLTYTGNLGIGADPVEALEIYRNGSNPVQLFHSGGVASYKLGNDGNVFKIAAMENGYGGHTGSFAANDAQVLSMTTTGNVGIGTTTPSGRLQIKGAVDFDGSTRLYLTNNNNDYGRVNLILTGRLQAGNDAWSFGSNARNSIVFATNTATSGANIGAVGTEHYSIQLEGNTKSLGFQSSTVGNTPVMTLIQSGNVGMGTTDPKARLQVRNGRTYVNKSNNDPQTANYANADLVIGDNVTSRSGYTGGTGSHIFLQSSAKSSITALDEGNDLGQISYENLRWIIGENVGWGNQNIQFPILSGTGTRMVTADATGLLGSTALPGGVLPAGTANQTLYHDGASWVAGSNLSNTGAQINLGQFTTGNTDEWPYVTWLRNTGLNWDEGLIKGSTARGAWGRAGFGIHMDATRHFGFFSSGWDVLADIEGGTGRMYIKGSTGIGLTNPGAKLTVRNNATDPGVHDDGKTLFASGSFGSGQAYDGGVEFRHDNLSQGIGFGYNTIYQTGTNVNEMLNLIARGTGDITLNAYGGATGNVGIGIAAPQSKLHVTGKVNVHQVGSGGGQNRFEGMEVPTSANGRAQLVLSSSYSDLIVASSQANDNHGSTITLATYDPGNAASYRKWVINQGNWGVRSQFLDFGYAVNIPNPHSAINSGNTTMTLDGVNRRVGLNVISPSSKLEILHNTAMADGMYDQSNIEVVTDNASNPSIGFHRSGHSATALYHAGYGNNSLRIRNADGLDAALLHEGNMGTYGIQNQNAAAQTANYWISGEGRARVFNFGHDNYTGVSPAFVDGQFYRRDGQAELAVDDLFRIRDNSGTVRHDFNSDNGEILLGPNPGWGRYLRIGGNGNQTGEANIATTDGNLHIDSRAGHAIYLQNYTGNNTFINPGGGSVGIGTAGPTRKLDVVGRLLVREGSIPNGWDVADWGAVVSFRRPGAGNMAGAHHGNAQLELSNDGLTTAHISFHRPGIFGANFGLDTDNWFSTQGWSAGGGYTSMRVGSFVANGSGNVTGGLVVSGTANTLYGTAARIYSNNDNANGGGIMVADDGGFFDYNDAWIQFRGSTGLQIRTNNAAWAILVNNGDVNGGGLNDKRISPNSNAWGLVGNSGNAWFQMWSYNFVNASTRESKRDITPIKDNLLRFVGEDLDRLTPYFYKYKVETDEMVAGMETKYRPNMHMGLIIDETPDYLLDNSFTGVDIYSVATMGIAAAKLNRKEIKEVKEAIGIDGNTISISDFGRVAVSGTEMWVPFKEKFSTRLDAGTSPVVTITANQAGVDVSVTEANNTGFRVRCTGGNNVLLNYIAMADVVVGIAPEKAAEQIPGNLMKGLRVDQSEKQKMQGYLEKVQSDKAEMERNAKIEGERIHQEKLIELSKPIGEPAKAFSGSIVPKL